MSIFLSNNIVSFLFIEFLILALMIVSQVSVFKILNDWNFEASTPLQYSLEKKNYLVNTIIYFSIAAKTILFIFFIKAIDELSSIVPGAMCSAGVIGANSYGNILLVLKIFIIFGFGVWLIVNKMDLKFVSFPYLRSKYHLFTLMFIFVVIELMLEILYFSNVPLKVPVFCCSIVFQIGNLPFGLNIPFLIILFYLIAAVVYVANKNKYALLSFVSSLIFLFIAYYAITYFFGTYVYELPTHKCPYCMLQREYLYVGYVIWTTLFLGVFFGISTYIIELITKRKYENLYKYAIFFITVFVVICTFLVIKFFISNGVLL